MMVNSNEDNADNSVKITNKFLIVAPNWLGDFVMMQSLLIAIKGQYKNALIDVLTPNHCLDLAKLMPEIKQIICIKNRHQKLDLLMRYRLGRKLKKNQYTWAIILPTTIKSALVPFFANIKKRSGFLGEYRKGLLTEIVALDKEKTPMMVKRYLSLINVTNIPLPKLNIRANNNADKAIIALCPGAAYGPAKQWPYFKTLAEKLSAKGVSVYIIGSKAEQKTGDAIAHDLKGVKNYAGYLSLAQSIEKLAQASVVVSNDSGLMHIASALGKKVIAIFGSSTPLHTPPLTNDAIVLEQTMACRPCFAKTCRYQHYNCLKKITADAVLKKIPLINKQ